MHICGKMVKGETMKLSKEALVEIMAIVQMGLIEGKDISQGLRDLDLEVVDVGTSGVLTALGLSQEYLAAHPRELEGEIN
jgi:hypothetical protein